MASQHPTEKTYKLAVPLVFKRRKKDNLEDISSFDYSIIVDKLDQHGLNSFIRSTLPYIDISAISSVDSGGLTLTLIVTSAEHLLKIFKATKKVKGGGQNALSGTINNYCNSISLEHEVGCKQDEELCVFVEMTETLLAQGIIALDDSDEEDITTKPGEMQTRHPKEKKTDVQGVMNDTNTQIEGSPHVSGSHQYQGSNPSVNTSSQDIQQTLTGEEVKNTNTQYESSTRVNWNHQHQGPNPSVNTTSQAIEQTQTGGGVNDTNTQIVSSPRVIGSHQYQGSNPSVNTSSQDIQQTQSGGVMNDTNTQIVSSPRVSGSHQYQGSNPSVNTSSQDIQQTQSGKELKKTNTQMESSPHVTESHQYQGSYPPVNTTNQAIDHTQKAGAVNDTITQIESSQPIPGSHQYQGSHPSVNTSNQAIQQTQSGVTMDKLLVVYVPTLSEYPYFVTVKLKSENPYLNDKVLIPHEKQKNMFKVRLQLPSVEITREHYWYEITASAFKYKLTRRLERSPGTHHSQTFRLNDHCCQRDVMEENPYDCIVNHLKDILFSGFTGTIEKSILEIDTLLKGRFLKFENTRHLMKTLFNEKTHYPTFTSELLLPVVMGNLLKNVPKSRKIDILDRNRSMKMLEALQNFRLKELPQFCQEYMVDVCMILCQIYFEKRYCLLHFMDMCQPFLDSSHFNSVISKQLKSTEKINFMGQNKTDLTPLCKKICLSLCSTCISGLHRADNNPETLLRTILLHVPVDVTLQIASEVSKTYRSEQQIAVTLREEILDITINSVKAELVKIHSESSMTHLSELWKNIVSSGMNIEYKTVEQMFLDILRINKNKIIDKSIISIGKLIHDETLFGDDANQNELLGILSDSECQFLHKTFIVCANMDKYRGTFDEHKQQLCMKWMKRAVTSHITLYTPKQTSGIFGSFFILSKLLTVESVLADEDTKSVLFQYVFKQIKKESLPSILRKTDDELESRLHPLVIDAFEGYLSTMVKKQRPEEILTQISSNGRLLVESGLTAKAICVILDDTLPFSELQKRDAFSALEHIVHQMKSWKMILKAGGRSLHIVQNNSNFQSAKECLKTIKHRLDDEEVTYTFLKTYTERNIHKDILELLGTCFQRKSRPNWIQSIRICEQRLNDVRIIQCCLSGIIKHVPERCISVGICERVEYVQKFKSDVMNFLFVKDLKEEKLPKEVKSLLQSSYFLEKMVHSKVFWNVNLRKISKFEFENRDEIINYIPILFGDIYETYIPPDDPKCETDRVRAFLDAVLKLGRNAYKDKWEAFMTDPEFLMKRWHNMFEGANIMEEIVIAEQCFRREIKSEIKVILKRLHKLYAIGNSVNAVKSSMRSCKIEDAVVYKAIETFDLLFRGGSTYYTFRHVGKHLATVFAIAEPLKKDTIVVLSALGNASNLIDFLRNIAGEDIRNLIDAVEDISEQHVQESTVAALIEVKRFLQPIVNLGKRMDAKWMCKIVDKQMSNEKLNSKMSMNIDDCMNNLHNLKSLYNNVANRSEQTKEIIMNIVIGGQFTFTLNEQGTNCEFKANYITKTVENSHTQTALSDLRSRALLLMNKYQFQGDSKENKLGSFVSYIDLCTEIAKLITLLHTVGHIRFKIYNKVEDGSNLEEMCSLLHSEQSKWCNHLTAIRKKYYLVRFLQGFHIHKLHTYLENDLGTINNKQCEVEVQTLLRIVHPKIQFVTLKNQYNNVKEMREFDDYSFIECIGSALHFCYDKYPLFERRLKTSVKDVKLRDVVQKGRLLLAQLEESSPLVTRTVVTLFSNTVQRLPEPSQVLFCTRQTTWAEIDLLLFRCTGAYDFFRKAVLYCIANVEYLPNKVQFRLVEALKKLDPNLNFHLAVICCGSRNHPFIDEFSDCVSKIRPLTDNVIERIFQSECPSVLTVTSETAGLGKTTQITQNAFLSGRSIATLHISGPMTKERIVCGLSSLDLKEYNTLHIDIGSTTSTAEIDTLLFELIVMGFVSTGKTSVYLPTSCISIEIANSIQDSLRKSLQTAMLFRRLHIVWQNYENLIVSREINSPIQVVCHFLHSLEKNTMDSFDVFLTGPHCVKPLLTGTCRKLLLKYFPSTQRNSFSLLNIFLCVLADQLKKMSSSSFFRMSRIKDMVGHKTTPTVKSSLVEALLDVSIEFSRRSVEQCRATQLSTINPVSDDMESNTTAIINQVKGMIRWEESNHLMYVFHNQNIQTLSAIYRDKSKVPVNIKKLFESQMKKELQDYMKMDQNELQTVLQKICRTNPIMIKKEKLKRMSQSYALTPDNLLKMILIILRIKSSIPVLVMGETGCGKTSLIRYLADMCEVHFHVLNIHAGLEEGLISEKITTCNKQALESPCVEHWLFFDEINTSEYVGMISDIICHHSFLGERLAPNLVIMGACNPYRLRSASAIFTAGLKGKVHTDQLSRLVYRVLPLPDMLVDYVWDFGSLNVADEKVYIQRMIETLFPVHDPFHKLFTELLSMSQAFIRNQDDIPCTVSLRDVQRCKTITRWFLEILPRKSPKTSNSAHIKSNVRERAIILALAHCYHSRITVMSLRKKYRGEMARIYRDNGMYLYIHEDRIRSLIRGEQEDILKRMDLPPGTAKNAALMENVFVLLVCILNRMPVFVVGKPGCSKSLSMQVIRNNLRGADSKDKFFKTLPQLYCVSFQGSESSTSDGIVKVFEKAERYQDINKGDSVLSVVILDEIGLAEISRFNPLKVLHNLLEPDGKDRPNVAVVGISNWSLDSSKMNRAIHLSIPDMDEQELYETGKSISDSFVDERMSELTSKLPSRARRAPEFATSQIDADLKNIAKSYYQYTRKMTFQNFHGLRDFYSLIKFFSKEVAHNPLISTEKKNEILFIGLERNFGGLPDERQKLLSEFKVDEFNHTCPVESLIGENVADPLARHLMLITSDESMTGVIEKSLDDAGRKDRELIIGSQFEEDLTDDYNYRILNRIILCMEQGLVLILKDLENIYGSLYDMLNQNYTMMGKKKNCRVALGPYSNPICHVADTFRCIVLVSDSKIQHSDPPFLNRFEKQYLRFSDIITPDQRETIQSFEQWINAISNCDDFDEHNSFPVYSKDMATSLVLRNYDTNPGGVSLLQQCRKDLLWVTWPEVIMRLAKNQGRGILFEPEENIIDAYLELPLHKGIKEYIVSELPFENDILDCKMVILFTKNSIHSTVIQNIQGFDIKVEKLGSFKSEKQLFEHMHTFWMNSPSDILFLQCSAVDDERHILLAKTMIEKMQQEYVRKESTQKKHVFLIIHVDSGKGKSNVFSQINFMSCWKLVALDSLENQDTDLTVLYGKSLREAFKLKKPLNRYIQEQLFWTFTRIKYEQDGRNVEQLTSIMRKIKNSEHFLGILEELISEWIVNNCPDIDDTQWLVRVASNRRSLQTSSSFIDALEAYILNIIDIYLVKYIYVMEKQNIIETFFVQDKNSKERITAWESLVSNKDLLSIIHIPDYSGPESYICNNHILELKMPFSMHVYKYVEETMDEYMDSVKILKSKCNIDPEDELPKKLRIEIQKHHKLIVQQKIDRLTQFIYTSAVSDYFDDFCKLKLIQICPMELQEDIINYMKHMYVVRKNVDESGDDLLEVVTSLHIAFWNNSTLMTSQIQLFALCKDIFKDEFYNAGWLQCADRKRFSQAGSVEDGCVTHTVNDSKSEKSKQILVKTFDHCTEGPNGYSIGSNSVEKQQQRQCVTGTLVEQAEHLLSISNKESHGTSQIENEDSLTLSNQRSVIEVDDDRALEQEDFTDNDDENDKKIKNNTTNSKSVSSVKIDHNQTDLKEMSSIYKNECLEELSGKGANLQSAYFHEDLLTAKKSEESSKKTLDNKTPVLIASDEQVNKEFTRVLNGNDLTEKGNGKYSESDVKDISASNLPSNTRENSQYEKHAGDGFQDTDIVQHVCEKMLPTEKILKHYSSINLWSIKASNVLALVVKVNPDSDFIHHLRICSDIVLSLVIPFDIEPRMVSIVAQHLLKEKFDSSSVYQALKDITDQAPANACSICHRILSTYFMRCIIINKESMAIYSLFALMCSNPLLCRNVSVYKPVIGLVFQLQQMRFLKIMKDGARGTIGEFKHKENDEKSVTNTCFFLKLNATIVDLVHAGLQQCPFLVMLVDILEDMVTRSINKCEEGYGYDEILSYVVSSHDILINKPDFDLQHVVAAAFFKACTHHVITVMVKKQGKKDSKSQEYIKVIMNKPDDNVVCKTLKGYIKKVIAFEKTSNETLKLMIELKSIFTDFDEIHPYLQQTLRQNSLDMCFTGLFIDETKQWLLKCLMDHDNCVFKDLMTVLDKERTDVCLSILVSYSEMRFYMPRSHTVPNDHVKSLALCFTEMCLNSNISDNSKHFLKCLTGTEDFPIVFMNHSEQTSMSDILLHRFLVSLLTVCLMQAEINETESFFMNCVFGRKLLEGVHLPGCHESEKHLDNYLWASLDDQTRLFTCNCKMRMVVPLSIEESFVCVECNSHIIQIRKSFENISINNVEDKLSPLYSTRRLSPLACQVVFLITKCCFLGSLALKRSVPEQLQNIFYPPATDIPYILWNEAKIHWQNIGKLLGVGENTTGIFLQTALNQLKADLFERCPNMEIPEEKLTWEVDFNCKLQHVYKKRAEFQIKLFKHLQFLRSGENELEAELLETEIRKDNPLAAIFRRKGTSSYHNFVTELHQEHIKFPLLIIVLQYQDKLRLPCHIKPIIRWHMAVFSSVNYAMKKQNFLNMTVSEFTRRVGDKEKTETLQKHFEAMQKSWTFLENHIQEYIPEKIMPLHLELKMESCIMYSQDCLMYKVLEYLAQIQNEFIDHTLCISRRCESVSYLKRSESVSAVPCVKVVDITKMQLVHFNPDENGKVFEWEQVIQTNSQSETLYGQGQKILYDFQAVEKLLASKLVSGKEFILCNFADLPKIVFTDELYKNYVSLSNDVKSKVEQEALSSDLVTSIYNKHKEDRPMCSELMTQVGMIMTLLNKTGGDPERCLVDYVEDMKNVLTKKFSDDLLPSPPSLVKLGHIVALYEVLEELNSDSIIAALDNEFRKDIEFDHQNMLKDVVKSQKKLGSCILQACKRFITRCLSIQEVISTTPLVEYLADMSFWPEGVCDGNWLKIKDEKLELLKVLPKQVMVKHIVSLVTVIEEEFKRIKEESAPISRIANEWIVSNEWTPVDEDQRNRDIVAHQRRLLAL